MAIDPAARPLPQITAENRPYWEAARNGELKLQRCVECGKFRYPIAPVCPFCLSEHGRWTKVSGRGTLSTWMIFYKVFFPAFADRIPYNVAMIELEEGPRLTTNVLECRNEDLYVGMPVVVCFERVNDEITLPQFRPVKT